MTTISARIVADSISGQGKRITTFVLTFPRMVLAEFNTHRALSRNSASSRAIPFKKMVELVENDPFIPVKWMKDHKGMQGTDYLDDLLLGDIWLEARDEAVKKAKALSERDVTKQLCNRLLEPFMWHTVICTGTEWENFFALRAHPDAEIHIQELAQKMLDAYNESIPKKLRGGEWHIPFGDNFEPERLMEYAFTFLSAANGWEKPPTAKDMKDYILGPCYRKIATARCARVSYLNYEGKDDYEADIRLHDQLVKSGHMSPFEHCAMNREDEVIYGNFTGWKQYRKSFKGENKKDGRVKQVCEG